MDRLSVLKYTSEISLNRLSRLITHYGVKNATRVALLFPKFPNTQLR